MKTTLVNVKWTRLAVGALACLALAACSGGGRDAQSQTPPSQTPPSQTQTAPATDGTGAEPRKMSEVEKSGAELVVAKVAEGTELRVRLPNAKRRYAYDPVLTVGDVTFSDYRYENDDHDVVFVAGATTNLKKADRVVFEWRRGSRGPAALRLELSAFDPASVK